VIIKRGNDSQLNIGMKEVTLRMVREINHMASNIVFSRHNHLEASSTAPHREHLITQGLPFGLKKCPMKKHTHEQKKLLIALITLVLLN
jgi:hypothetical protein